MFCVATIKFVYIVRNKESKIYKDFNLKKVKGYLFIAKNNWHKNIKIQLITYYYIQWMESDMRVSHRPSSTKEYKGNVLKIII